MQANDRGYSYEHKLAIAARHSRTLDNSKIDHGTVLGALVVIEHPVVRTQRESQVVSLITWLAVYTPNRILESKTNPNHFDAKSMFVCKSYYTS
jgi:hypothetical protein